MYNYDGNNSTEFDISLNPSLKNGLCWLPWVGKDYSRQKIKLLLVGESHYASKRERTPTQQLCDVDEVSEDKNFTRDVVYASRICRWWSTPTLSRINWSLVGRDNFDGKLIWNKIAFYNFVQRPMKTIDERPTWEEFASGWRNFIDVACVLKPTICVFIGNSAANFFNEAMATLNIPHSNVNSVQFVNGAWGKEASIDIEGKTVPIHSIRHAGRFFSWEAWHNYLKERIPDTIDFLEKQIVDSGIGVSSFTEEKNDDDKCGSIGVPTWLSHKPIIASKYENINPDDSDDAKFLSIGRAQYNMNGVSVKIFRHSGQRWSRQSEEVPIQRIGYLLEMLIVAILHCQKDDSADIQSELMEEIISPQDIDFLREQIRENRHSIFDSLNRIRALIDEIDPGKI